MALVHILADTNTKDDIASLTAATIKSTNETYLQVTVHEIAYPSQDGLSLSRVMTAYRQDFREHTLSLSFVMSGKITRTRFFHYYCYLISLNVLILFLSILS